MSFISTVPVLILLMTGEAVQYKHSIFTDIVNYSRLFRYVLNMTGNAMFRLFAWGSDMYFLKRYKEYRFHILMHS